jgi:hypothetical protein
MFGKERPRGRLAGFPGRNAGLSAVAIGIACLAILITVLARDGGPHSRAQQSATIQVLDGNTVSFRLKGASGADLAVQYLRPVHGPTTIWITLVVSGLPQRGIDYAATGGECLGTRSRTLAASSGLLDPRTGILIFPLHNMPASATTSIWVKEADVSGVQLGGVRGPFFAPNSGVPIAPPASLPVAKTATSLVPAGNPHQPTQARNGTFRQSVGRVGLEPTTGGL